MSTFQPSKKYSYPKKIAHRCKQEYHCIIDFTSPHVKYQTKKKKALNINPLSQNVIISSSCLIESTVLPGLIMSASYWLVTLKMKNISLFFFKVTSRKQKKVQCTNAFKSIKPVHRKTNMVSEVVKGRHDVKTCNVEQHNY